MAAMIPTTRSPILRLLTGILLSFLLPLSGIAYAERDTAQRPQVQIVTGEWPPLITERAEGGGPILTVVREAFAATGMEARFSFVPWRRAIDILKSGEADASAAWRLTPGRQTHFYASGSVYAGPNVFFHLKSTPFQWNALEDLANYRVGGVSGYAYSVQFLELVERGIIPIALVRKEPQLVGMLKAGRIDVFPGNLDVINHLIRQQYPNQFNLFTYDPRPFTEKPLHVFFPRTPHGKQQLEQFDEGLNAIKKTGRFKEIFLNYAAKDPLKQ